MHKQAQVLEKMRETCLRSNAPEIAEAEARAKRIASLASSK